MLSVFVCFFACELLFFVVVVVLFSLLLIWGVGGEGCTRKEFTTLMLIPAKRELEQPSGNPTAAGKTRMATAGRCSAFPFKQLD